MGFLKDLLLGSSSNTSPREKSERVSVYDHGGHKSIYDSQGHWKEDLRYNRESGRWDKLDFHGNVTGHIERNSKGEMVHRDYNERITGIDRREDSRTVSHYDSKGNKTGYTTKDYNNNLTKHTYIKEERDIFGRIKKK